MGQTPPPTPNPLKNIWRPAAVAAAAFLAYANSLHNGFVWDDHLLVENNPALSQPSAVALSFLPASYSRGRHVPGAARPALLLSLIADHNLWGLRPGGYHLTNVSLHVGDSLLAYSLAQSFLAPPAALFSALLFALHPIHTESVDVITFRSDLLACFFLFLGLLAYRRCEGRLKRPAKAGWLFASAACYLLGLLSKEMAITMPALALLADGTIWRRMRSARLRATAVVVYAAVAGAYLAYRFPRADYGAGLRGLWPASVSVARSHPSPPRPEDVPVPQATAYPPSRPQWAAVYRDSVGRALSMSEVFGEYWRLMFLPYGLEADRLAPLARSWRTPGVWLSWIALAAFAGLGLWALLSRRAPLAWGVGWTFIALAPVSNIIPIYNPMAERYLYIVSAGPCWIMGWLWEEIGGHDTYFRSPRGRNQYRVPLFLGGFLVLAAFGAMTIRRNRDWKSDESVFSHRELGNARVQYNLGVLAQQKGDLVAAAAYYRRAIEANPGYSEALTNLAGIEDGLGDKAGARRDYLAALALAPSAPIPYDDYGLFLEKQGGRREARRLYRKALDREPGFIPARMHLAADLAASGRVQQAVNQYHDVIRRDPSYIKAYVEIGMLLDREHRYEEAAAALSSATARFPADASLAENLGVVRHHEGRFPEALRWLNRAKALDRRDPAVRYNLGTVYSDQGDLKKARKEFRAAVQGDPVYAAAWYNLGVVEQRLGDVPAAIKAYDQAVRVNPRYVEAINNLSGLYEDSGRLAEARKLLAKGLALSPREPFLHANLGNVALDEGKIDQARIEYLEALADAPSRGVPRADMAPTLSNLGLCYLKQGAADKAAAALREAVSDNPRYAPGYLLLSEALVRLDRPREARAALEALLRLDPGNQDAARALGLRPGPRPAVAGSLNIQHIQTSSAAVPPALLLRNRGKQDTLNHDARLPERGDQP